MSFNAATRQHGDLTYLSSLVVLKVFLMVTFNVVTLPPTDAFWYNLLNHGTGQKQRNNAKS